LEPLKLLVLQKTVRNLQELSHQERVYDLKMNPDRAEVVDHAGLIYAEIMSLSGVSDILAPNIGLKDGIIRELWTHQLKAKPAPVG
jgi:exopolyphosphatase/guanosine-5'-triphosphate,3'-diphosphate pyrophosphatase